VSSVTDDYRNGQEQEEKQSERDRTSQQQGKRIQEAKAEHEKCLKAEMALRKTFTTAPPVPVADK
jgi:hypothetical protein